jgi:hypothetical protein
LLDVVYPARYIRFDAPTRRFVRWSSHLECFWKKESLLLVCFCLIVNWQACIVVVLLEASASSLTAEPLAVLFA